MTLLLLSFNQVNICSLIKRYHYDFYFQGSSQIKCESNVYSLFWMILLLRYSLWINKCILTVINGLFSVLDAKPFRFSSYFKNHHKSRVMPRFISLSLSKCILSMLFESDFITFLIIVINKWLIYSLFRLFNLWLSYCKNNNK